MADKTKPTTTKTRRPMLDMLDTDAFWADEWIASQPFELAAFYLHLAYFPGIERAARLAGLFVAPIQVLAAWTNGWTIERTKSALAELQAAGKIAYDGRILWVIGKLGWTAQATQALSPWTLDQILAVVDRLSDSTGIPQDFHKRYASILNRAHAGGHDAHPAAPAHDARSGMTPAHDAHPPTPTPDTRPARGRLENGIQNGNVEEVLHTLDLTLRDSNIAAVAAPPWFHFYGSIKTPEEAWKMLTIKHVRPAQVDMALVKASLDSRIWADPLVIKLANWLTTIPARSTSGPAIIAHLDEYATHLAADKLKNESLAKTLANVQEKATAANVTPAKYLAATLPALEKAPDSELAQIWLKPFQALAAWLNANPIP
jgi:hypothetical protein